MSEHWLGFCFPGPGMFGAIKRLFKKNPGKEPMSAPFSPAPVTSTPSAAAAKAAPAAPEPVAFRAAPGEASEESVSLPFELVVPSIPKQLIKKVDPQAVAQSRLTLRYAVVLEQLASGCLKVPLSALRASGPNGMFVAGQDYQMISLPLKDVLAALPKELLARREQRKTEVPAEIGDVFGPKGTGASVRFLDKSELAPTKNNDTVLTSRSAPSPSIERSAEKPAAGSAGPVKAKLAPDAKLKGLKKEGATSVTRFTTKKATEQAGETAAPVAAPSFSFPQPQEGETLAIPVAELLDEWPEAIRLEIAYQNLSELSCKLPVSEVIEGLKRRKLQYPWKTVRGWVDTNPSTTPSPHGEALVDLPVKSVMSRFFAYQANKATDKPVEATPAPTIPAPKPSQPVPTFTFPSAAPASTPAAPAPVPASAPAASAAAPTTNETLRVPLDQISGKWPAEIRREFKKLKEAALVLPVSEIENGMRRGKVAARWDQVRVWIEPALTSTTTQGEVVVELPLAVLAPIFLRKCKPTGGRKTELPSDIPDVFEGGKAGNDLAVAMPVEPGAGGPAAPIKLAPQAPSIARPAVAAAPAEAEPAPVAAAPAAAPVAAAKKKPGANIAEIFGQPGKKNWTPNEIVHHTNLLPNVAGAMIALQDGLLVAGCMPPNWKTETVAAFLPQIFGRLRQYSRDLEMGELISVSFGVQQGTLEIFNAGIIYFAALSRPGDPLPLEELTTIAHELSRHTK